MAQNQITINERKSIVMKDKEIIKAEIKRRRKIVKNAALQMKEAEKRNHYLKMVEEYDDILRYIDTSTSKPVIEVKIANEAPEKLYVDTKDRLGDTILYGFTKNEKPNDIEYTRTDVFLNKACSWLKDCLDNGMWIANDVGCAEKEAIIENFKKYMEGE